MQYGIITNGAAIALSSMLLTLAAIITCGLLRKRPASLRHLVLIGMFVSLLALPVMTIMLPTWNLPFAETSRMFQGLKENTSTGLPLKIENASPVRPKADPEQIPVAGEIRAPATTNAENVRELSGPSLARAFLEGNLHWIILALWGAGSLIVLIVQLVRWAGAGFIAEMASTVEDRSLVAMAERIRWEMGIKRRVGLLRSEMAAVSMVWGIKRPYIILPACSDDWPAGKMEAVLRHELSHVKRQDNFLHLVAVCACALYWFNPLAWIAMRKLHFEREVACDNAVLNAGCVSSAYARHLLDISLKLNGPKSRRIIPAVMAHSSDVKKRLVSVLSPDVNRRPLGAATAALCIILVLGLALPVSAFRLWSDGPSTGESVLAGVESIKLADNLITITGDIHTDDDEDNLYFRGRRLSLSGSYSSDSGGVFIHEAEMEDKESDIECSAKNVFLDPDEPFGCRFKKEKGNLSFKRREKGDDLEYVLENKKKRGKYKSTFSFYIDGKGRDGDELRKGEFREMAAELHDILDFDGDVFIDDDDLISVNRKDTGGLAGTLDIKIKDGLIENPEGTLEIEGTVLISDGGVFLTRADIRSKDGDLLVSGNNVILDPDFPKGYLFENGRGFLLVKTKDDDVEYEFRVERERVGKEFKTVRSFYTDGDGAYYGDREEDMLRQLCVDLHGHLYYSKEGSSDINIHLEKGDDPEKLLRHTGDWSFRGSLEGSGDRVVIVRGELVNEAAYIKIEGKNAAINPETALGCSFIEDEGHLYITRYAGDDKLEYRYRRRNDGGRLVARKQFFRNGVKQEFTRNREEEFKAILHSAYLWLTDKTVRAAPAVPSAPVLRILEPAAEIAKSVPPVVEVTEPAPPIIEISEPVPSVLEITEPIPYRTVEEAQAEALAEAEEAEKRQYELFRYRYRNDRDFEEEIVGAFEELGEEFARIEESYKGTLDSRRAETAIVKAYEAREDRIDRIKDRTLDRVRGKWDTSAALDGCNEILEEYERIAVTSLESLERGGPRSELKNALIDFYGDLIEMIDGKQEYLEDHGLKERNSKLYETQQQLYREIRKELVKTREAIEDMD